MAEPGVIDLDNLALSSGQAKRLDMRIEPRPPRLGGEAYPPREPAAVRVDVSRTTTGHAMRLRSSVIVAGACARCLEPAERRIEIDVHEVDQPQSGDPELTSPYVSDAMLDVDRWLADALALALPDKILCRDECAGLCEVCGIRLDSPEAEGHSHERAPDPRFAKLRDLG
jgi:uncharacterized protein